MSQKNQSSQQQHPCQLKITSYGIMHMKNLICGTTSQKSWTTTKNGTIHQSFLQIQVQSVNPQKNILNRIFILTNVKPKYETFETNYNTVYYRIPFAPLHVQQAILFCTFEASTITRNTIIYIRNNIQDNHLYT